MATRRKNSRLSDELCSEASPSISASLTKTKSVQATPKSYVTDNESSADEAQKKAKAERKRKKRFVRSAAPDELSHKDLAYKFKKDHHYKGDFSREPAEVVNYMIMKSDQIISLHDLAVENGANAVMLNVMTVGVSAVCMLRKHARVPIMSHFDLFGAMTQVPYHGIQEKVFTKLQRMAGVDALIYPGLSPRMKTTEQDVHATVDAGLADMGIIEKMLPIPGGSQWAGSLETLYQAFGHADFGVIPGRAVFDHPMGPRCGAASMRQGWKAVQQGVPLMQYAQQHRELQEAIQSQQK